MRLDPRNRRAFTLVELLVVVAIIALLIGILIPAIGRARAVAQQTTCLAQLRGIGNGVNTYAAEWDGWLPGPHTSGSASLGVPLYPPSVEDTSQSDDGPQTQPMSNFDWWSPTLGAEFGLPEDHFERYRAILNQEANCPANVRGIDDGSFGFSPDITTVYPDIKFPSYSMLVNFATWPEIEMPYNNRIAARPEIAKDKIGVAPHGESATAAVYPAGYAPNINRIGNLSEKIVVMEGARSVESDGSTSANGAKYQIEGGAFMIEAPFSTSFERTPWGPNTGFAAYGSLPDSPPSVDAEETAFRHGGGLNRAYFDGHAEHANYEEVFLPEPYLPSKSELGSAASVIYAANHLDGREYKTGDKIR